MEKEHLDFYVAKALGWYEDEVLEVPCWFDSEGNFTFQVDAFTPSTNWQQAGMLVEKFKISLYYISGPKDECWYAELPLGIEYAYADTPLEAVCLVVIYSHYDEDEV